MRCTCNSSAEVGSGGDKEGLEQRWGRVETGGSLYLADRTALQNCQSPVSENKVEID